MPAHNEEDRIGRTLSVYRDACPDPDIRFLVAMDDCRDRTAEIVKAHAARDLLFDVDLLASAAEAGHRIVEVPTIWIDQEGSRVSAVGDSGRMGASLLRLWARRRARRAAPLPRKVAALRKELVHDRS